MNKIFKTWLENTNLDGYQLEDAAGIGWEGCKEEILNILNNTNFSIYHEPYRIELIKKINEL